MRTKSTGNEKSRRSQRIPQGDLPVGGEFDVSGEVFVVVESGAEVPEDACCGCAFSGRDGRYRSCPNVRCSAFDRSDGLFVWFVRRESL